MGGFLALQATPPAPRTRAPREADAARPGGGRVLVVDDEEDIRETLRDVLASALGVEVDAAASAFEAQALIQGGRRYDVVLTDERMPGMRGTALLAWLREAAPHSRGVLMSAFYEEYVGRDLAARTGATHFVRKPIDLAQLLGILREGLEGLGEGPPPAN